MHKTERLMLENFPLEDYQENRTQYGHMQFVRQAFCREIAPGAKYEECLYRRGDGVEVWVYLVHLPKDAPVQLAVAAAPLRMAKPTARSCSSRPELRSTTGTTQGARPCMLPPKTGTSIQ